jgi:hypothetical protein
MWAARAKPVATTANTPENRCKRANVKTSSTKTPDAIPALMRRSLATALSDRHHTAAPRGVGLLL